MSLSKTLYPLLSTCITQEDRKLSQHNLKIVDWDIVIEKSKKKLECFNGTCILFQGSPTKEHPSPAKEKKKKKKFRMPSFSKTKKSKDSKESTI